jgi:hypothetical protein
MPAVRLSEQLGGRLPDLVWPDTHPVKPSTLQPRRPTRGPRGVKANTEAANPTGADN